jgi:phosphate-selective porin OprO and OprP
MHFKILIVLLISSFSFSIQAQTGKQTEISARFNDTNGIQIESKDTLFSLNLRFRIQNRFEYTSQDGDAFNAKSSNFLIRRMRVRAAGYLYNPKLNYVVQLGFSRNDLDWDATGFPHIIRDAVISYKFTPALEVGLGQTKLPGNRQRNISSGEQQFVDLSLNNATFNLDRDAGLFVTYKNAKHHVGYNFYGAITNGNGRNYFNSDKGLAYTGKVEILPFGAFALKGDYFEGDWVREQTPKLSVAAAYSYNSNASRRGGTIGDFLSYKSDIKTLFFDFILKYKGLAIYGEYAQRDAEKPLVTLSDGSYQYIYKGQGFNFQTSYQTVKHFEIGGRVARIIPSEAISSVVSPVSNFTLVATKYLKWHRVKVQSDITYQDVERAYKNFNDQWQYRFQLEIGI